MWLVGLIVGCCFYLLFHLLSGCRAASLPINWLVDWYSTTDTGRWHVCGVAELIRTTERSRNKTGCQLNVNWVNCFVCWCWTRSTETSATSTEHSTMLSTRYLATSAEFRSVHGHHSSLDLLPRPLVNPSLSSSALSSSITSLLF